MKASFRAELIALGVVMAALNVGYAQADAAAKELEKAVQDYLTAVSARDVEGLRAVLDKRLTVVEASGKNARIHWVDTGNSKELLPPEGNRDWDNAKVRLSSFKAEVSGTHPSVAMASFTLTFSLMDKQVADLEAALKLTPDQFDESRRKAAAKMIAERAVHSSMFAMLARQDGKWKIVSMSLPK